MVEEGWYTDPQDASRLRYWDGTEWTEHTHDRPDDEPEPEVAEEVVEEPPVVEEPVVVDESPLMETQAVDETPPTEAPVEAVQTVEVPVESAPVDDWVPVHPPPRPPPPQGPLPPPPPPPPAPVAPSPVAAPDVAPPAPSPQPPPRSPRPQPQPRPQSQPRPQPQPAAQPAHTPAQYRPQPQPAYTTHSNTPPQAVPAPSPAYPPAAPEQRPVAPEPDTDLGLPTATPGHLNDVGQWLRRTFNVGLAKLVPCGLLAVLGFIPAVFFYAVAYLAVSEATDDRGAQSTTIVMFILLAFLFLLWMVWVGIVTLAQNHLLYRAHIGKRTSIGQSMQAGVQGVGRLVWAYLTLVVYVIMVVAVVGGLTFLFSLVSSTLGGVFFVISYVAAVTLSVWLGVKLIFLVIASAVAPPGDRPMVVSVETTNGYFWAVLGRVLLLGVILSAALVPLILIFVAVFGSSGSSFLDDPGSGSASAMIGTIAVGGLLYLLVTLAMQVFSTSGIVRLYVDLGGPARIEQAPAPET